MIPPIALSREAQYERISVATFATHDHKPLRALWEEAFEKRCDTSDQARHDLAKIAEFAGLVFPGESTNYSRDFYPAIFEALFRSESWIALVMITDLLGRKDRFNVPGTHANSNWTRRLQPRSANWAAVMCCTDSFASCASCLNEPDELSSRDEAQRVEGSVAERPGSSARGSARPAPLHFARDDKLVNCG